MSANDKRVVKVNNRSGFDKSFRNSLTGKCGTLIPILVDEIIPDTKVNLKINLAASLPPLVSDTYMNVRLRIEAFAVPHRLTQANFEDFYCDYPGRFAVSYSDASAYTEAKGCMPLIKVNDGDGKIPGTWFSNGTLMDYFGIPTFADNFDFNVPIAPFVAYWLIWQEWYRNPRVQTPAFVRPDGESVRCVYVGHGNDGIAASIPYTSYYFDNNGSQKIYGVYDIDGVTKRQNYDLHNGSKIVDLAQRNFGLDFFTAAMLEPQQGDAAIVTIDGTGDDAGFTIASLRAQNSIQQFRERNNLTSPRYQQQIYARYGCAPSDGVIQRPILIGAATYDVYSHGVTTNAVTSYQTSQQGDNSNYFAGSVGARQGNGFASGSDFIISGFHAKEPMYLMVLASLVPEVSYSQNMNFIHLRYKGIGSISDMANPILQNVGPQPIRSGVLGMASSFNEFNHVFAYTDRYSDWMFKPNEVHGEFKEYQGGTLSNFVLQRTFSGTPEFGSEFLTIPTDYLDGVLQFTSESTQLTYWLDVAFDYKVSMPLQEYAIPSLQDPGYEHGHSIVLRKNGQLL